MRISLHSLHFHFCIPPVGVCLGPNANFPFQILSCCQKVAGPNPELISGFQIPLDAPNVGDWSFDSWEKKVHHCEE